MHKHGHLDWHKTKALQHYSIQLVQGYKQAFSGAYIYTHQGTDHMRIIVPAALAVAGCKQVPENEQLFVVTAALAMAVTHPQIHLRVVIGYTPIVQSHTTVNLTGVLKCIPSSQPLHYSVPSGVSKWHLDYSTKEGNVILSDSVYPSTSTLVVCASITVFNTLIMDCRLDWMDSTSLCVVSIHDTTQTMTSPLHHDDLVVHGDYLIQQKNYH